MNKFKSRAATTLMFSLLATSPLLAQEEQKELPPTGGTPKDFQLPAKETFTLPNGLRVTLVEFGNVPKATISIMVQSGNLNDGDQTWLADLSADFLLEGTDSRSSDVIAREAAAMGGRLSVRVGEDQTNISGTALSEFAPEMLVLLADVIQNPAFPESELERLKRDQLRRLSIAKTQPQRMATVAFRKALYGDHPYGRLQPDEEQFSAFTLADARSFYDNNFGARRSHVYVAGMFDKAATRMAIENAFEDWKEGPEILVNIPTPATGKVVVDVIDRPGAMQSNVFLGLPTPGPGTDDWIPLQVSNTLLGGFFSSRITANIREDKGYTYSPVSTLTARYRDSYWAQIAAVTTEVTGPAIQEIMKEIDRLQDEPPSSEELDGVKNYAAGVFVLQNSTRGGIISVLNYLDLHDLPDSYLSTYISEVFAVTPEQVSETVSRYLRQKDMTLVVVGDRGQVSEQVDQWVRPEEE